MTKAQRNFVILIRAVHLWTQQRSFFLRNMAVYSCVLLPSSAKRGVNLANI